MPVSLRSAETAAAAASAVEALVVGATTEVRVTARTLFPFACRQHRVLEFRLNLCSSSSSFLSLPLLPCSPPSALASCPSVHHDSWLRKNARSADQVFRCK